MTLVLPIDILGPASYGLGSQPVATIQPGDRYKVDGEDIVCAPMLPPEIKLSTSQYQKLANYLYDELSKCESERKPQIDKISRLKQKYRIKQPLQPKNFPIANASQITIPVIKTSVNTLNSRIFQTLMAADPLARVKTKDEDFQDFVVAWEEFLKLYGEQKLNIEDVYDTWCTEVVKLGTGVIEITNALDRRAVVYYDAATGEYQKRIEDRFSGPILYNVPIEDFWIRVAQQDPQKAPWCGKLIRQTWSQVKDMAVSGDYNPNQIEKIRRHVSDSTVPQTIIDDENQEEAKPVSRDLYDIHELFVRWDADMDGVEEELIVYFHRQSRTILRMKYNGFKGCRRPYVVGRYVLIENRFYAEGVAEQLEGLQDEISTIHNQRIDNSTIANLRIILVSKIIQGLRPGDRLWSGKIVKVTDVKNDVGTLQLGEVYPSTVQAESISQGYVREVSGASEAAMGQAQPVTRTTATAQLSLLEELNRRFDKTMRGLRRANRDLHVQLTDLFVQQGTNGLAEEWLGQKKGMMVEQFLALPPAVLDKKISILVSSTKSTNNREVDFQTQIAVMNLIVQMGEQMLGLTGQLAPQATGIIAHELVQAIRPVFKKVMQYADASDPDQAVAVLNVLERILPAPEQYGVSSAPPEPDIASVAPGGNGAGGTVPVAGGPGAGGQPPFDPRVASLAALLAGVNGSNGLAAQAGRKT